MFVWDKKDLNNEQTKAVLENDSILLIACPGSGKTRTLIYKIAFELSKLKSEREYIIAITYTNRAADEIKERVEILGVDTSQLWIGTIHAFCLEWILRPYFHYLPQLKNGFKVLNSHESEEIITTLCEPYKTQNVTFWDCGFLAMPSGKYRITSLETGKHDTIQTVIKEYFKILRSNDQIDFEQILHFSYQLLIKKPIINDILCKLFPYILIDEFQDTKEIQYYIIAAILKAGKASSKTLIVGDPNQSIYDSLGGFPKEKNDLEALLAFSLKEYSLELNYRSSSRIVEYFDFYKTYTNVVIPSGKDKDYPSIITYNTILQRTELENEVERLILFNIKEKGILPNEICIVAPQWVHLAGLTRNLMVRLPEYSFDGPGMAPFSRDIDNFWYKLSRIVLTEPSPTLYIRRLRWSKEVLNDLHHAGVHITTNTKEFLRLCNSISIDEENGLEYLRKFFCEICFKLNIILSSYPGIEEHYISFFESSKRRIERLIKDGNESIADVLSFRKVFKQREGITISTIHGVKGEEYDTVIGFGLLEDYVPHFSDKKNGQINAKKMLYVLSSRARKNLHLISESGRNVNKYNPKGLLPTKQLLLHTYSYD